MESSATEELNPVGSQIRILPPLSKASVKEERKAGRTLHRLSQEDEELSSSSQLREMKLMSRSS